MKRFVYPAVYLSVGFVAGLAVLSTAQGAGAPSLATAYRQLDLFGSAFERVRENYVRQVEDGELVQAAINGMATALDPHSRYLDAEEYNDSQQQTRAEYGGLGLEVTAENGVIKVVAPIDGTPAERAGLISGDYITSIDGMSVEGVDFNDAVEKMRGPENSQVTLTVIRNGELRPFEITLTRRVIRTSAVRSERKGDIGYIRISTFMNVRTADDVRSAVRNLQTQIGPQLKGYVIDLRNDPGGLLDQAIAVSDHFLPSGEVVSIRGRRPQDTQRYAAKDGDITNGKPVVVLINEGSASASEIVAGALQDHRRATIIGMTSFGKGSVQTVIPLAGGRDGALWLTTARYYTPSGRSIQATGIAPDIAVSNLSPRDEAVRVQFSRRSEARLAGHLEQEEDLPPEGPPLPVIRPEDGVRHDDFQLQYALDRLNGTVVTPPAPAAISSATPADAPTVQ
jgi:carboxyl-terminal processing protease